ncbi:hypothetical protein D3C80_1323450 [compost metagenome]
MITPSGVRWCQRSQGIMCCFALSPPGQANPVSYKMALPLCSMTIARPCPISSIWTVQPSDFTGRHNRYVSKTLLTILIAGADTQARNRQPIIASHGKSVTGSQRSSISIQPSGSPFNSQNRTARDLSANSQTHSSNRGKGQRCNSIPAKISGTEINVTSGTAKILATNDEMLIP